jgi:hypothetical protein
MSQDVSSQWTQFIMQFPSAMQGGLQTQIAFLFAQNSSLMYQNAFLLQQLLAVQKENVILQEKSETALSNNEEVQNNLWQLGKEVSKRFAFQQTTKHSLTSSIFTQAKSVPPFLQSLQRKLNQPQSKRKNGVIKVVLNTPEEVKSLYPGKKLFFSKLIYLLDLLKKTNEVTKVTAELVTPLELSYSPTTKKLRARFMYKAKDKKGNVIIYYY